MEAWALALDELIDDGVLGGSFVASSNGECVLVDEIDGSLDVDEQLGALRREIEIPDHRYASASGDRVR